MRNANFMPMTLPPSPRKNLVAQSWNEASGEVQKPKDFYATEDPSILTPEQARLLAEAAHSRVRISPEVLPAAGKSHPNKGSPMVNLLKSYF